MRYCGESSFRLQTTFAFGTFYDLPPNIFPPIFTAYWKKGTYFMWSCIHTFQYSSLGSQVNIDIGLLSIIQILQKEFTFWGSESKTQFDPSFAITLTSLHISLFQSENILKHWSLTLGYSLIFSIQCISLNLSTNENIFTKVVGVNKHEQFSIKLNLSSWSTNLEGECKRKVR